jgi:hypothetical protein
MMLNASPADAPMITACRASACARKSSPAPIARLIADDTPPPMAPADSICCIIAIGNTIAMAARAGTPSSPT